MTLTAVDQIFTGVVSARTLGPGECAEVATGAPLPLGADAVVMVEQTSRQGERITVRTAVTAGQHVGRQGSDIQAGSVVVRHGDFISPARLGTLAAVGHTTINVLAKPRVAILSTGNEVLSPGAAMKPGHVYDVNRFTLQAVVEQHGGTAVPRPPVGDALEDLTTALSDAAASCDVVVCSGGSSVGGRDLLVDVVTRLGRVHFHGLAIKPGKPTLFGSIGSIPIFGMPGNPTSCLSNAYMLLVPFLRRTAGLPTWSPTRVTLPLARRVTSTPERHQFYTVTIRDGQVEPAFKSSGDITSMAQADGYIEIPMGVGVLEAGTQVTVTYF